jgi:hypothetical protein
MVQTKMHNEPTVQVSDTTMLNKVLMLVQKKLLLKLFNQLNYGRCF